jgi:hypothetical protein
MSAAHALELESELSFLESEGELSGELEQELELANELATEFELEHELEGEHEAFFNSLAAMADRRGRSQALRRVALAAAKSALRGHRRPWPVVEGELGEYEFESELGELEGLGEFEFEASPAQLAHVLAEMEHEAHSAAEAANEQEAAEHFLPLIGLAAKFVLPKLAGMAAKKLGGAALKKVGGKLIGNVGRQLVKRVAPKMIKRVTPQLQRGVANVTRTLFRNRATRPLINAVPRIARQTVARLGAQAAKGRRITPQTAVRTLAQQTARTLSNPRALAQTYRRSLAQDRRYHRRSRRLIGRPAGAPVRAADTGSFAGGGASPAAAIAAATGLPGAAALPAAALPALAAMPGAAAAIPALAAMSGAAAMPGAFAATIPGAGIGTFPAQCSCRPAGAPACPACGR